jgi:glucose/arabinose dehydrogenase
MNRTLWGGSVLACVLASDAVGQPLLKPENGPWVLDVEGGQIRVVPVARDLVHPTSLAFLPNGDLLVAELTGTAGHGRLRLIRDGQLEAEPVWKSPATAAGRAGALKSVALHPDFAENRLVYVAYPKREGELVTLAVARGRLEGESLEDVEELFVADAWETGGNSGTRILFGPDNSLYMTVGDRDALVRSSEDDPSLRLKAQALDSDAGKTLRIREDGSVPDDNPFVGQAGANPQIFTYGHRNGYGLAFHPETGELWQAEIGPMGGDEVNILVAGHNYGWPLVSTGRNYTGTLVSDQPWWRPGMDNPRIHWVPSISPSSILFYTGDKFPEWRNNLFVGALTSRALQRIAFRSPSTSSQTERRENLLTELEFRVRDVAQSPDGYIYVATELSNRTWTADGMVLRIEPIGPSQ